MPDSHHHECTRRLLRLHRLDPPVADALGAHLAEGDECRIYRGERLRFEIEVERRRETGSAEDAQAVLGEAFDRLTDGADDLRVDVLAAAERVDERAVRRIDR